MKLTQEELEAIRKRVEDTSFERAYVKGDPWKGYEVRDNGNGMAVAETSTEVDAEFIAHAREDVPKLLAEIERLKSVLSHIDDLSDEFFNIEVIDGQPTFTLRPEIENFRGIIHEIAIVSYEAVRDDD
jgi:hypothetical protein